LLLYIWRCYKIVALKANQKNMGFESPQEDVKAEEAMTPEQAELTLQREESYGKLSPEQQELLKESNLNVKQRTALGGLIGGFQRIITGTIGENKVEIVFDPHQSWEGFAEAKVDGEELSREDSLALRDKYLAVAEYQTKENANVKQSNAEIRGKLSLREKVAKLLS
jgi:hypothetical protein